MAQPWQYHTLSKDQRVDLARLSQDVCIIKDTDHLDYFVRVCLEIPISGVDQPHLWGVWISVSEGLTIERAQQMAEQLMHRLPTA
ncbi:MAG TPA: DUF2199 domain-containing protein [Bradyrhizobium sp.]